MTVLAAKRRFQPVPPTSYNSSGSFLQQTVVDTIAGTNPEYSLFYQDRQHMVQNANGIFFAYNYTDSNHNPAHWRLARSTSQTSGLYDGVTWSTAYTDSTDNSGGGGPGIETDSNNNVYVIASLYNDSNPIFKIFKFTPADNYVTPTIYSLSSLAAANKWTCIYDQVRNVIWISTWERQNSNEIDLVMVDQNGNILKSQRVLIDWSTASSTAYAKADYTYLTVAGDGTLILAWHSDADVVGTHTLNGAINTYYEVRFIYSPDAATTWYGANGAITTGNVFPDGAGASNQTAFNVIDTTPGSEFILGTDPNYYPNGTAKINWNALTALAFNNNAVHFQYIASTDPHVINPGHTPYTRFDWASKAVNKRIQPLAATTGTTTTLDNTGGNFVQDTTHANRLYFVGNGGGADFGKIVCMRSDDAGVTWVRYAASTAINNNPIYTGACRWTQPDGSLLAYTVQATTPFSLYFFRIK